MSEYKNSKRAALRRNNIEIVITSLFLVFCLGLTACSTIDLHITLTSTNDEEETVEEAGELVTETEEPRDVYYPSDFVGLEPTKLTLDHWVEIADQTDYSLVTSSRALNSWTVYDSCDLGYVLNETGATADDCRTSIKNNNENEGVIPKNEETILNDFVTRIEKKYPNADLSVLSENLKTLKIVYYCEEYSHEIQEIAATEDALGAYDPTCNWIELMEGVDYEDGEGFRTLFNLFSRAARNYSSGDEESEDRVMFRSQAGNELLEECMNSMFADSLLNYETPNVQYFTVPGNYLRIMLDCMGEDVYSLEDYINHSDTYFMACLDTWTGDWMTDTHSQFIWNLITLQYEDYKDTEYDFPAETYEPIYEYIANMYFDKYITDDMTEEERKTVAKNLAKEAFSNAPAGYRTDPDFFTDYLDTYMQVREATERYPRAKG